MAASPMAPTVSNAITSRNVQATSRECSSGAISG